MVVDRRQRRWLCGALFAVLLFAQLATAAYACPRTADAAPAPAAPAFAAMAAMPDCSAAQPTTMDPEQPQLCKAHCDQGAQTLGAATTVDLPVSPLLMAVLDWSVQALAQPIGGRCCSTVPSGAPPPGTVPLYLSLLVLRC
jgi:hypothetical protein